MRTSSVRPVSRSRWVLFGVLLLVHPLVPAAVVAALYVAGPSATQEPLLVRCLNGPAVGLVYAVLGAGPGIVITAAVQAWLRARVPPSVEAGLVVPVAVASLAGWYGVLAGRVDVEVWWVVVGVAAVWALAGTATSRRFPGPQRPLAPLATAAGR